VSVVAVPDRLSTAVPSPQLTVMLVGEFVAEKLTVTAWLMTAGLGRREVMVTTGTLTDVLTVPLLAPLLALLAWTESLGVYVPVMVAVPVADGVNVTEQVPAARVQLGALNVPAEPLEVNPTDPAGVDAPAPLVSATVAVHVDACPTVTVPGLQTTVVEVVRRVAVTEPLLAPLLALPA
jgi:hypothetical protein